MNIIFFANGKFAIPSIESIHLSTKHNLIRVITNKDKVGGRGKKNISTDVANYCKVKSINMIQIESINSTEFEAKLKSLNADIYIVISYKILPEIIFSIPRYNTINVHASLLPSYRGAAPIQRSIINGESYVGLTVFEINKKIDSGKIVNQKKISINETDNFGEIHDKLSMKAPDLLINSIDLIESNKRFSLNNQESSYAKKIDKKEFKIDLNSSSVNIHNLIRGLTPPSPYLLFDNKRVKLYNTYYNNNNNLSLGEWSIDNHKIHIGCNNGSIEVLNIQFAGKKIITVKDFENMNLDKSIYFE